MSGVAEDTFNAKSAQCPVCKRRNTRTVGVGRRHGGRVVEILKRCQHKGCGTEFTFHTDNGTIIKR